MPKLQRYSLPLSVLSHIHDRVMEREISVDTLAQVLHWFESNPVVPDGRWFKRFEGVVICGKDAMPLTTLDPGKTAVGTEVD